MSTQLLMSVFAKDYFYEPRGATSGYSRLRYTRGVIRIMGIWATLTATK